MWQLSLLIEFLTNIFWRILLNMFQEEIYLKSSTLKNRWLVRVLCPQLPRDQELEACLHSIGKAANQLPLRILEDFFSPISKSSWKRPSSFFKNNTFLSNSPHGLSVLSLSLSLSLRQKNLFLRVQDLFGKVRNKRQDEAFDRSYFSSFFASHSLVFGR